MEVLKISLKNLLDFKNEPTIRLRPYTHFCSRVCESDTTCATRKRGQETMDEHELHIGDCVGALRSMPGRHVQCCVTSPPYFGLRDYGVDGQIGLEQTPERTGKKASPGTQRHTGGAAWGIMPDLFA